MRARSRKRVCFGLIVLTLFIVVVTSPASSESVVLSGEVREFLKNPGFVALPWQVDEMESQTSEVISTRGEGEPSILPRDPTVQVWEKLRSADFNGDGCRDLLIFMAREKSPYISLSDCKQSFLRLKPIQEAPAIDFFDVLPLSIDIDDCADVLFIAEDEVTRLRSTCDGKFTSNISQGRWPVRFPMRSPQVFPAKIGRRAESRVLVPHSQYDLTYLFTPIQTESPPDALYLPRDHSLIGSGDFRIDRPGTILVVGGVYGDFKAFPVSEDGVRPPPFPVWQATFPLGYSWSRSFIGDFNGDGISDVLAYGGPVAGWWLAQSNGFTGLESPTKLPWSGHDSGALFESGDFDGDGYSELLRCSRQASARVNAEPRCTIARLERGPLVSGARIFVDGKEADKTSHAGEFVLPLELEKVLGGVRIELRSEEYLVNSISSRKIQTSLGRRPENFVKRSSERMRVIENFLVVAKSELLSSVGAPVHYVSLPPGPKICLGYSPAASMLDSKWGPRHENCPPNSVWLASNDSDTRTSMRGHFYDAYCCPLPSDDILEKEETETVGMCPEDFVAVGTVRECDDCPLRLRCKRINRRRYKLGPVQSGVYYGQGASSRWVDRILDIGKIPSALRVGVRRRSDQIYSRDGCIAPIAGSPYVGNSSGDGCGAYKYRQIQYSGPAGESSGDTPIRMFPDCRYAPNPHSPTEGCVPKR